MELNKKEKHYRLGNGEGERNVKSNDQNPFFRVQQFCQLQSCCCIIPILKAKFLIHWLNLLKALHDSEEYSYLASSFNLSSSEVAMQPDER